MDQIGRNRWYDSGTGAAGADGLDDLAVHARPWAALPAARGGLKAEAESRSAHGGLAGAQSTLQAESSLIAPDAATEVVPEAARPPRV